VKHKAKATLHEPPEQIRKAEELPAEKRRGKRNVYRSYDPETR
jgi:hypothetical protein